MTCHFRVSHSIAYNGYGFAMVGALNYKCLNIVQMSNRITKAELLTSAPILAKPMLADVLFSGINFNF